MELCCKCRKRIVFETPEELGWIKIKGRYYCAVCQILKELEWEGKNGEKETGSSERTME